MKYLLIVLIFYNQASFAQNDSTIYYKEVGWTIKLPLDFKITDLKSFVDYKKAMDTLEARSGGIIRPYKATHLLSAARDRYNVIVSTFYYSPTASMDSLREMEKNEQNNFYYLFSKQLRGNPDTLRSIIIIDGQKFDDLYMYLIINEKFTFHGNRLTAFYKGGILQIVYTYTDVAVGNELSDMLDKSKFNK